MDIWCFCGRKTEIDSGVVISHFYPEWMDMYGNELSENGLKRVMKQGARVNVNYNYFYTQTGVDHASIYTGMLPTEHGIVSRAGTIVYAGNASILPNPIVIQRSVINRRIV